MVELLNAKFRVPPFYGSPSLPCIRPAGRTGAHVATHRKQQVWQGTNLEDVVVEENHDDAGDIE